MIRRVGFVDQAPEQISVNSQGQRLANAIKAAGDEITLAELQRLVGLMDGMKRLTTSFRFETGSTRPDAQSRENISQLARAMEAGEYDTKKLIFVGFSDGEGAAAGNRKIAMKRAETVRDAVVKAAQTASLDRMQIEVEAFGAPIYLDRPRNITRNTVLKVTT